MAGTQKLHMVAGGELEDLKTITFRNLDDLDIVGIYPNYEEAVAAWRTKAQSTVDNAHMRYFVFNLHKLIDLDIDVESDERI
ncbi:MAG: inositol monophosphatase [Hyphomicrobiales bacterium]|nr:MAG: inositol monophosphatase [Hyphomicrobiales bacterium]